MKNDNKKLAMYIGIALLVGAVGFVVYNKFSASKLPTASTNDTTDETKPTTPSKWSVKNPFSSNPANQLSAKNPFSSNPANQLTESSIWVKNGKPFNIDLSFVLDKTNIK
jgi:cell division protein FtsN